MISYLPMVNAWSLAWETLFGDMDKEYPIIDTNNVGAGNTASQDPTNDKGYYPDDGLDYEVSLNDGSADDYNFNYGDAMANIDDMYSHHFTNANSPYNDGWTQEFHQKELEKMDYEPKRAHYYKYHEEEILKDIEEYVSSTYQGHYTGTKHEFRKVQTIDLMAARDIAAQFCQANILKYGSRYGSKDGRNKKDLLKVIHYAMLLLHFDGHYGDQSMPSGNFDQMP
jgi:hypothetical protein